MPTRVQMSRHRPWRAEHPDAVIVDRRTPWGNPFQVVRRGGQWLVIDDNGVDYPVAINSREAAVTRALGLFRNEMAQWSELRHKVRSLAGRDLACWCRLGSPCHADVLLNLANPAPAGHDTEVLP